MRQRACGVVITNDHVLMVRHVHDDRDYWTFPGGGIEAGETIFAAARREVLEETGILVDPVELLYRFEADNNLTHCVLMSSPTHLALPQLGQDPEEAHLDAPDRMLQDVAWRLVSELVSDPFVGPVLQLLDVAGPDSAPSR